MTKRITIMAIIIAAGLTITPTLAQEASSACTNAGNSYDVGEVVCIAACHGARRLARCDLVVKRPSWVYISEDCPSAMFISPPASGSSQPPLIAAMSPRPGPLKISTISTEFSVLVANLRIKPFAIR